MKKITAFLVVAAAAALLSSGCGPEARRTWQMDTDRQSGSAPAGIITVTSGPTFTPESAFTNNTITVDTTQGSLAHVEGGATITPDASNQVMIQISGTYSADAGDILSIAYSFSTDLNRDTPVTYTANGIVTISGFPIPFDGGGTLTPGLNKFEDVFQAPPFFSADSGTFSATVIADFGSTGALQAVAPGSLAIAIQQVDVKIDPAPATLQLPSQLLNISTRLKVGTDDNVLIGGFIITGNDSKEIVLRAIGPSLAAFNVADPLADPMLELHDSTGATIAMNDNWMDLSAEDQTTLTDNNLAPSDDAESALVAALAPGAYTTIVRGVNDTTGVGLVEAYDIGALSDSKLANISTRGFVETGDNAMIGGVILGGGGGGFSTVIVRGIGPSLASAGITNALADPVIELRNSDGDVLASNDNWMDDPNMQTVSDAGLAPSDPNEAALYTILPAGAYTAIFSGAGGTSGVGLVESYNTD